MDVTESRRSHRGFHSVLLALVASLVGPVTWAAAPKIAFNIPAGEFSQAIIEFSKQSQVEILYASVGSVSDVKTRAVVGKLEVTDALRKMLEGTEFTFEFENARSILVKRTNSSSNATQVTSQENSTVETPHDVQTRLSSLTESSEDEQQRIAEVVVTGSFIRGMQDIVSPLIIVAEKGKKQAAYGTVQDVLRLLPSNFGGGPSEDFSRSANFNRGSSVDLRGTGSGASLVLVNGRRQPVSGVEGDFVDVSTIPLSAVKRIEVLPDGSSALYGSDAVAGVVNIIMREDLEGAETQARLGVAQGGADETLASQLFGHRWDTGKWLLAYQYSERTALAAADRPYSASADKRPFGGTDQRTFSSSPGNILDPMTLTPAFAIPAGQNGVSLRPDDLLPGVVNLQNQLQWRDLVASRKAHSAFITASQKMGERFELFGEGRYNHRRIAGTERPYDQWLLVPATNPFFVDPFGGMPFVIVAYNFANEFGPLRAAGETNTYTGTLGIKSDLANGWQSTLSGFRGRESMRWTGNNWVDFMALDLALADPNPETAFNPFGSGANTNPDTLHAIQLTQFEGAISDITTMNLVADGPLPDLPAGTPRLAVGLDYRQESLKRQEGRNQAMIGSKYGRHVTAAFAELSVPVVPRLDLSLAARYETYSDFGNTLNPKIGLRWAPMESLKFRGTWGSSFRAPTLVERYERSQDFVFLTPVVDPRSPTGSVTSVLARTGSNSSLHEETAITWTAGLDFAPETVPGFTLSLTYHAIDYKDRTWRPRPPLTIESILAEDQWASLVTRDPSQLEVDALCGSSAFLGSPADCIANPPSAIVDVRVRNLSMTTAKGVDIELQQPLKTGYGSFNFELSGSYLLSFAQAVTRTASSIDIAGTALNPPTLRLRSIAEWHLHGRDQPGFGASLAVDYLSSSQDYENPPVTHVGAWTTTDLQLNYRTTKSEYWLGNVELTLNIVNVFDEDPPFMNRIEGYDLANAEPFGRVIGFGMQKNW